MKILLATNNLHKVKEIKYILKDLPKSIKIISLLNLNVKFKPKEDGKTYKENAVKKAVSLCKLTKKITLADDSGLEIDYLKGAPGIKSSRFLGKNTDFLKKMKRIIGLLKNIPANKRKARFICSACLALPDGKIYTSKGICEGFIDYKVKGKYGFGYDPIFYLPKFKKTMAQLNSKIKNKISHRAKAFGKMRKFIVASR